MYLLSDFNALDSLGNHQEALQYYDKALAFEPNAVVALEDKGSVLDHRKIQ